MSIARIADRVASGGRLSRADALGRFEPVHAGQHPVEKNQTERIGPALPVVPLEQRQAFRLEAPGGHAFRHGHNNMTYVASKQAAAAGPLDSTYIV